jgi:cytochrome c
MSLKLLSSICFLQLLINDLIIYFSTNWQQENTAPEVRITKPPDQSTFQWSSIVPYSISVSDREDGKSEYDEIAQNEVLLEVTYVPDATQDVKNLAVTSNFNRKILRIMSKSNCLNCHAARTKLIGPSFDLISERYESQSPAVEILANKLMIGSKGVWGDEPMPPHPELNYENAKEMVHWILNFDIMPNYNFYTGTEGAFKTREKPKEQENGIYILEASYVDHGVKDEPNRSKEGRHIMMLTNKKGG